MTTILYMLADIGYLLKHRYLIYYVRLVSGMTFIRYAQSWKNGNYKKNKHNSVITVKYMWIERNWK